MRIRLASKQIRMKFMQSKAFRAKGPRVALRRWFSWLAAAHWHDGDVLGAGTTEARVSHIDVGAILRCGRHT